MTKCETCEKEFLHLPRYKRKFCSVACSAVPLKGIRGIAQCSICDITFKRQPSRSRGKYGLIFCSRKCASKGDRLENGFHGKEVSPGYYAAVAARVKDWTCGCGEGRNFLLFVHHMDGNRDNNPVDGSNWEIVCANCHIIRHLDVGPDGKWVYRTASLTPRELIPTFAANHKNLIRSPLDWA